MYVMRDSFSTVNKPSKSASEARAGRMKAPRVLGNDRQTSSTVRVTEDRWYGAAPCDNSHERLKNAPSDEDDVGGGKPRLRGDEGALHHQQTRPAQSLLAHVGIRHVAWIILFGACR